MCLLARGCATLTAAPAGRTKAVSSLAASRPRMHASLVQIASRYGRQCKKPKRSDRSDFDVNIIFAAHCLDGHAEDYEHPSRQEKVRARGSSPLSPERSVPRPDLPISPDLLRRKVEAACTEAWPTTHTCWTCGSQHVASKWLDLFYP